MNCKKCGIRLNDSWESCPACGTAVKEEKLCAKCGYKLDDEWKSCPACGAEVEKELLCAKCGYKLNSEWVSCPACGAAVKEKSFCKHCGREIEKNWHICPSCGHETVEKAPEEEFKHSTPEPETAPIEETPVREDLTEDIITSAETADAITDAPEIEEAPDSEDFTVIDPVVEPINKPMKWHKFLVYFGIWAVLADQSLALVLTMLTDAITLIDNFRFYSRYGYKPDFIDYLGNGIYNILPSVIGIIGVVIVIIAANKLLKKKRGTGGFVLVAFLWPLISVIILDATSLLYQVIEYPLLSAIKSWFFGYDISTGGIVSAAVSGSIFYRFFEVFFDLVLGLIYDWIEPPFALYCLSERVMPTLITLPCVPIAIINMIYCKKRKDIYKN